MHGPEKYPGFGTSQRTADGERAAWSSRVKNNREQPEERRASQGAAAEEYAEDAGRSQGGRRKMAPIRGNLSSREKPRRSGCARLQLIWVVPRKLSFVP